MPRLAAVSIVIVFTLVLAMQPVRAAPAQHCGTITSTQTWGPGNNPHTVCSQGVRVQNATITIVPGAIIAMEAGANLVVGQGGSLQVLGDANGGKIRVVAAQGDEAGFWGQVRFEEDAAESQLNGIDFRSGGRGGVPMVEIRGGPVIFDPNYDVVQDPPVEFHNALGVPLAMRANVIGPGTEPPGRLTVGGQCTRLVISGNGVDAIRVLADLPIDVTQTQIWHNFCVPYLVSDPIVVGGPDLPLLEIDYGTEFAMEDDGGFVAGADPENVGYLAFMGTPDKPVKVSGREKTPGSWGTIQFTEFSGESEDGEINSFMNTVVEYGGRGGVPMVQVRTTNIIAYETQFGHALAQPLALVPAAVAPFMSALVRSKTPTFVENGENRIIVLAKETAVDITENAEWGGIGAPYQIDGELLVANPGTPANLTLSGNAKLLFDPGAALVIGDANHGRGRLRIAGYITDSVTLGGTNGAPGSWPGIRITDHAELVDIDAAVIENGGTAERPMVEWGRVPGRLVRSTLRGAVAYPLAVPLSRLEVVMDEEHRAEYRNRLVDNGANRILVQVDGPRGQSHIDWADPGAPLEFDGNVIIGSPNRPLVVMHDGLALLFRAGAGLQIGITANDRAAVQVRDDVLSRPVSFGAAQEAGWAGLRIMPDSTFAGSEIVFSGAAADAANVTVNGGLFDVERVVFRGSKRGIGLSVVGQGARADVSAARFEDYRIGVHTANRGRLDLSRSTVRGNLEWGVKNEDAAICQRALRVFWGVPTGPEDDSDARDGCMNAKNHSPGGDRVSDDVEWWPFAVDESSYTPVTGVGPNPKRLYLPALDRP